MAEVKRIWVRQRRWWWEGIDPDEVVGTIDSNTVLRSRTEAGVIRKWRKRMLPKEPHWKEVLIEWTPASLTGPVAPASGQKQGRE